jgi:HSP20 family protein
MGKPIPREEAEQVNEQIAFMVSKLWQWHEGDFCPVDSWTPAVNVYRAADRIEVCIDVAGMDRRSIEVRVEAGRLVVQGLRDSPEPSVSKMGPMKILAMEIDHGRFCRTIDLPGQIDVTRVESKYENGMLWVKMRVRDPA